MLSSSAQRSMCGPRKSRPPITQALLEPKVLISAHAEKKHNINRLCEYLIEPPRTCLSWSKDSAFGYPQMENPMNAWTKGTNTSKVNVRLYYVNKYEEQAFRHNTKNIHINRGTNKQP